MIHLLNENYDQLYRSALDADRQARLWYRRYRSMAKLNGLLLGVIAVLVALVAILFFHTGIFNQSQKGTTNLMQPRVSIEAAARTEGLLARSLAIALSRLESDSDSQYVRRNESMAHLNRGFRDGDGDFLMLEGREADRG